MSAIPNSGYTASIDAALAGRVLLKVGSLAEIADCSVDHLDLEIKRGELVIVGEGRRRRVPVESARTWLERQVVAGASGPIRKNNGPSHRAVATEESNRHANTTS